jgi:hypothetical protein
MATTAEERGSTSPASSTSGRSAGARSPRWWWSPIVLFIDGFDMYFFGKILPAVAEGLGVTPQG